MVLLVGVNKDFKGRKRAKSMAMKCVMKNGISYIVGDKNAWTVPTGKKGGKVKKVVNAGVNKKGYIFFLDKDGNVACAKADKGWYVLGNKMTKRYKERWSMAQKIKKMVVVNVNWMKKYKGLEGNMRKSGGDYVKKHGFGSELYNFQPYKGYLYGAGCAPKNSRKLGGNKGDRAVNNVLIVWAAQKKGGGIYVVGWYNNATVYVWKKKEKKPKWLQRPDKIKIPKRKVITYFVKARAGDCCLLPERARKFKVPRGGKGEMGQKNIWYPNEEFRKAFFKFRKNRKIKLVL